MSGGDFTTRMAVSGKLVEELGDRFIKDNGTAIAELVKNSYDADATKVIINFENAFAKTLENSRVTISDNGCGMDRDDLTDFFFTIATSNKQREKITPKFGRWSHGERGLGRFGLQKLGFYSTVITRKEGCPIYSFEIDWTKFTQLEDISEYEFVIKSNAEEWKDTFSNSTGTIIIIKYLKQGMGGSNLQTIHRKVSSLVNPFQAENDFKIDMRGLTGSKIQWASFDQAVTVAQQAHYHFKFELDESSRFLTYDFQINHPWNPNFGEVMKSRTLEIKTDKENGIPGLMDRNPRVYGLNGEINVFYRTPNLMKQHPLRANWGLVSEDHWYDLCGVKIYRNNARVYPYGNRTGKQTIDDSLMGINEEAARSNANWLRQNQLIGAISFDGEKNNNLVDTSNREGLVNNENYSDFVALLKGIIKYIKTELISKNGHRNSPPPTPTPQPDRPQEPVTTFVFQTEEVDGELPAVADGVTPPLPPPIVVSSPLGGDEWSKIAESMTKITVLLNELGPSSGKNKIEQNLNSIQNLLSDAKDSLGD